MKFAGALPLDHSGIVVGNAQGDFDAELLGKVFDERRPAIGDGRLVLGRDHCEIDLRIFLPPIRRGWARLGNACEQRQGQQQAANDHRSPRGNKKRRGFV
jgi:hypothetical protein